MDHLSFGYVPAPGVMYLSQYSDFVTEIISNTGSWPGGAVIEFRFLPSNMATFTTWPGTITGATASWDVSAADVAQILAGGADQYQLMYTANSIPLEWSKGQIVDVS
jgi:hypothetical protein